MIRTYRLPFVCLLAAGMSALVLAQSSSSDRVTMAFSDPTKPGTLEVGLLYGGIAIKGYEGREVVIESSAGSFDESEHGDLPDKAKGMRRLENRSSGLRVEEDGNVMTVSSHSFQNSVNLRIQVPRKTSLNLSCVNDGDILVENVEGEIEVNNVNGGVRLERVSGSVVAHCLNDDLIVVFDRVDPTKAMSFSSLNGDLDITLPADLKANVKLKTDNGEIFTDFDIKLSPDTKRAQEEPKGKGSKKRIVIENAMYGTINAGGPEYQFTTFNGDILIRRKK